MLRFAKSAVAVSLIILPFFAHAFNDSIFLKTAELECISDGVETATGRGGSPGLTPSAKFLALVGFGMQRFQKGTNGTGGLERIAYQQKIIEFIQANGFCLSELTDANGQAIARSVGYGGKGMKEGAPKNVALMVLGTGTKPVNADTSQSAFNTRETEMLVKQLGFNSMDDIKAIFQNDTFSGSTPDQRQKFFNAAIKNGSYSEDLKECFRQVKEMQAKNPALIHNGTRSPESIRLCEALKSSCALPNYDDGKSFCEVSRQSNIKPSGSAPKSSAPAGSGPSLYNFTSGSGAAQ